ncbi:ABC transporter substrate-binding protein [Ralstonia solanacearum]|uniref:ABC transporter substrate-binding protein n=1 Tax=Ralstonia solanacearum TaxID=305 RepID=UPI0018D04CD4|nr:ABC transporter substrate-binding protein [Ralstonia solanacearum]MDC6210934.1 ABC transporter substrate-binding protein [Ralstonia solanacearum]
MQPTRSPARRRALRLAMAAALATSLFGGAVSAARAEASEVRISHGYGVLYLPIMVMASEHLLEKQAKAAGLGDVKVSYRVLDGGNVINDAMLSGALDIASLGVPGFLTLWDKTRGSAMEVRGLSALSSSSMYLMTRNPNVKTLADFSDKDRIAVPGIKTSLPAVVLQMAAAKAFGDKQYNKLDPITVPLPHPDATAVLLAGGSQINSHMASPPFSYAEAAAPGLHRVFNTVDVLGNITLDMTYTSKKFYEANPRLSAAFVAALDEANALIAKDKAKAKAAQIYIAQSRVKSSPDEVKKILDDPDSRFTTTPVGVARYAEFMQRVGTLKSKPASWKDLFFPTVQNRQGS